MRRISVFVLLLAVLGTIAPAWRAEGRVVAAQEPAGTLRIADAFLPATLDPARDGFNLLVYGVAETLTRIQPDQTPVPWLAERVDPIDSLTWRVALRPDATFWDGSPVDAEAVASMFQSSWETQPDAANFVLTTTRLTVVDSLTLDFVTPEPLPTFPNNLATFQFIVAKPGPDGGVLMTGAYRPVNLIPDQSLTMTAYPGHWGGPPPVATIEVRLVADANTRLLALQSGEVDLITGVPPEGVETLPDGFTTESIASNRVHSILFNHERPLFQDLALRGAVARGIDREALNQIGLAGLGAVGTGPFSPSLGIESPLPSVPDVAGANRLLDEAGWLPGDDGIRTKDGERLAFALYSYPSRPELTPIAIGVQDQLAALGMEVAVEEVADISGFLAAGDWDIAMWSFNPNPTGDPQYFFNLALGTSGVYNPGAYSNQDLDAVAAALGTEADPARRRDLTTEGIRIAVEDAAAVYLLASPRVIAYDPDAVGGLVLSPNDLYLIDTELIVTSET